MPLQSGEIFAGFMIIRLLARGDGRGPPEMRVPPRSGRRLPSGRLRRPDYQTRDGCAGLVAEFRGFGFGGQP